MKLALVTISAIAGIFLVGVCMVYSSKNGAISLEESVNAAKSGIDVQLVNRFNKLTELAECVKKYDEHEYKTLLEVITARGKNMSANDAKQCIAAVNAVAEQYPELRSQSNYSQLMTEISLMENHLAQSKKAYNEFVRDYNRHVRKFPTSIFLGWTGYETVKYDYYEADESVRDSKPMTLF